jgi:hypothetical protein
MYLYSLQIKGDSNKINSGTVEWIYILIVKEDAYSGLLFQRFSEQIKTIKMDLTQDIPCPCQYSNPLDFPGWHKQGPLNTSYTRRSVVN